jgi:hypothetical protein
LTVPAAAEGEVEAVRMMLVPATGLVLEAARVVELEMDCAVTDNADEVLAE